MASNDNLGWREEPAVRVMLLVIFWLLLGYLFALLTRNPSWERIAPYYRIAKIPISAGIGK